MLFDGTLFFSEDGRDALCWCGVAKAPDLMCCANCSVVKKRMIRQLRLGQRIRSPTLGSHLSLQQLPLSLFSSSTNDLNERKVMTTTSSRCYSMTPRNENPLIFGGIGILAVAGSLHVGMILYQQYQQKKNSSPEVDETTTKATDGKENKSTVDETTTKASSDQKTQSEAKTEEKTEESAAGSGFFGNFFATTFYDGGFGKSSASRLVLSLLLFDS
jgi:hypothetical protein